MDSVDRTDGYTVVPSSAEGLAELVRNTGAARKFIFRGAHVVPGGEYRCRQSEMETALSCETIRRIAATQGRNVREKIERSENPACMRRGLEANPDSTKTHLHLGMACREQGRAADARMEWETALRRTPEVSSAVRRRNS